MPSKTNKPGITVEFSTRDLQKALKDIKFYQNSAQESVKDAINKTAIKVQSKAKQNASGRPGPKVDFGRLRSSIKAKFAQLDEYTWYVQTDVEYARRLEFGFYNKVDRLGRRYYQQAYPFLNPAAESERKDHRMRISKALLGVKTTKK